LHLLLLAGLPAHYQTVKTMTHEYPRHPPARPGSTRASRSATPRLSSSNTMPEATDPRVEPEDDESTRVNINAGWY
jgi:hypothetical protein